MKFAISRFFFVAALACLFLVGCAEKRLEGLSLDQIPTAIDKAFEKADVGIRMQAEMVAGAIKGNQWLAATTTLNDLLAFPKLTEEQRRVLSQAQLSVGARMREVADEGSSDTPAKPVRKIGEPPPSPVAPEEAAAAATALRIYQQSK